MKAFLRSVIEGPEYEDALRARMIAGKAAHMEPETRPRSRSGEARQLLRPPALLPAVTSGGLPLPPWSR